MEWICKGLFRERVKSNLNTVIIYGHPPTLVCTYRIYEVEQSIWWGCTLGFAVNWANWQQNRSNEWRGAGEELTIVLRRGSEGDSTTAAAAAAGSIEWKNKMLEIPEHNANIISFLLRPLECDDLCRNSAPPPFSGSLIQWNNAEFSHLSCRPEIMLRSGMGRPLENQTQMGTRIRLIIILWKYSARQFIEIHFIGLMWEFFYFASSGVVQLYFHKENFWFLLAYFISSMDIGKFDLIWFHLPSLREYLNKTSSSEEMQLTRGVETEQLESHPLKLFNLVIVCGGGEGSTFS